MTHNEVVTKLLAWMQDFVEQPHPSLGGWPPCPYARQARMSNNIDIRPGHDPYADCLSLLDYDWSREVVVFWYDHTLYSSDDFLNNVDRANKILLAKDIVALEDHPDAEELISGVKMNFSYCAIIVLQQNSKLNSAAAQLKDKGYYTTWSTEDVDKIVTWRH